MQICMKMTSLGQLLFQRDVAQRMAAKGINASGLAEMSRIHQSQVSRIMAGKFKNVSSNIMQICISLDLRIDDYVSPGASLSDDRERIMSAALSAWNGSSEDARALSSLLKELAGFRR
jgi:DNA-binding Xre family transcriptional regulator